ncbi:DUF4360 domain-containing protein [Streptomyces sp. NBC_01264]|uniref:DUF4360 domain-containing protein n=1 Tax=Streptomyces sp. NBC_01264 TaxID=2903804 RepID=UPI00225271D4|nr:DUF4360 domain-containing protein [Streptomyces sp. NBC_01264]MCX4781675.1 DUF4360 domain-containing protein [Streptomyces sp. NBC_01264]
MALRSALFGGTLALASALSAFPAQAQPVANPPGHITVEVQTVNGSGCRQGTASVAAAEDNTAFTVTYSDYLAQAGGGSSPIDSRKNCQLGLQVHVPQGFTYAIARADFRGFAYLQPGASALQRASYYFQGMSQTTRSTHQFRGPLVDNWQSSDETDYASLVWAPCGEERTLNVNTELRVTSGTDPQNLSFIAMDSTDGSVSTKYHLEWKQCPAS